jgi:hypothetical protein
MVIRPMIGSWEVPSIERIATREARKISRVAIPGLDGDLQQGLGAASLVVEMVGSLQGDQARDAFLEALREPFRAGQPVSFTADILTASELDQVLIEALDLTEVNEWANSFRYRIVLRQYVEPPAPPTPIDDLGAGLDAELSDLAGVGLDALELPDLLGDLPALADPVAPLQPALEAVRAATGGIGSLLDGLRTRLLGS